MAVESVEFTDKHAQLEKKMNMTLDDIVKESKEEFVVDVGRTVRSKPYSHRPYNKVSRFVREENSRKIREFTDLRSLLRQKELDRRRSSNSDVVDDDDAKRFVSGTTIMVRPKGGDGMESWKRKTYPVYYSVPSRRRVFHYYGDEKMMNEKNIEARKKKWVWKRSDSPV